MKIMLFSYVGQTKNGGNNNKFNGRCNKSGKKRKKIECTLVNINNR